MSSYLSQPYEIQAPQQAVDTRFMGTILSTLQNKYDANKAEIDKTQAVYNNMLKGLRDIDNEYIAAKLKSAEAIMSEYKQKNGNLAFNTTKDTLLSALKAVTEDPIVQSAVSNRAKFDRFNTEVAEKKKKADGSYSDINYEFSLEQGGYSDYMKGKAKDLGSLNYIDFTDVQGNYTKRLKEYVDQYDDEQYLGSQKAGEYHTVDIYGKRVLKEDLEKFLKTTTTPQESKQMYINTWSKFKGVDENGVVEIMKPIYEERLKSLRKDEATYKAKADSGDKDAKESLKSIQSSISDISSKVESNSFSKGELYQEYSNQIIKDFASLYDKNIITKKDVQDYLFDEIKFDTEKKQWLLTYEQKDREIALKKKEVGILEAAANGTITEYPGGTEDKEESEFETANKQKSDMFGDISKQISSFDAEFAAMNTTQKAQYIANLNLDDPSKIKIKNITPELRNSILKWQGVNKNTTNFYSENLKAVQPIVIGSFNDIQDSYFNDKNSELAFDKVANYLPNTARVIKDAKKKGKQLNWADIPQDDRYAIQVEFLSQYRREGDLSKDQAKVFATNEYIMKNKIKNKDLVASLNRTDEERGVDRGYFEDAWEGVKEVGRTFVGAASDLGAVFKRGINTIKEGSDYAKKQYDQDIKESYTPNVSNFKGLGLVNPIIAPIAALSRSGLFSEEENFRNIESRDLLGRQNIGDRFSAYKNSLDSEIKNKFGVESPFMKYNKAVSYSTDIKEQKGAAELIRQTIMATNPDAPIPSGDNYTIKQSGTGYEVIYQVKDGNNLVNAEPIYLDKLPAQLQNTFQQKQDEWNKSIYNPNFKIPSFTFETPKTVDEAKEIITNLSVYGGLDNTMSEALYTSGLILPASTYLDSYVSEDIQERNKQAIENFKNQEYTTKTDVVNGNLYSTITYRDIVTGENKQTKPVAHKIFNEQVEAVDIQLDLLSQVDLLKQKQLSKLK